MRKQVFFIVMMLLLPLVASAYDAQVGGIYYDFNTSNGTATVTYYAFFSEDNASVYSGDVVIPDKVIYNGVTYKVTAIGGAAFAYCTYLTSVTIPSSITIMNANAFMGCYGLTAVYISDLEAWLNISFNYGDSTPLYRAHHLFLNGTEIKEVVIPSSMTKINDYVFYGCSGLTSVTIPNGVTTIGSYAFAECNSLKSITIPNSVKTIDNAAFYRCVELPSVTIPNSVTSMSNNVFSNCYGLESVIIGDGVPYIGVSAFINCYALSSVTLGSGVKSINGDAFTYCYNLANVYCYAEIVPQTVFSVFRNVNLANVTLHVPGASVHAYGTVLPWKTFKQVVSLDGDALPMCAMPTIKVEGSKLTFGCATEGVTFVWNCDYSDINNPDAAGNVVVLEGTTNCVVSVYATKEGYQNSDIAKANVGLNIGKKGDLNNDGQVTISDAVGVVNMILNPEPVKHYLYGEDPNFEPPFQPGAWDAMAMRFSYIDGERFPTIPDDVYFNLKTLIFDVSDVSEDFSLRVMNGWWSNTYYDNVKWVNGLNRIQITETMAQECAQGGQGKDLTLMLRSGTCTINGVYYEE